MHATITANNWLRRKRIKFSSFRVLTTLLQWTSLAKKKTTTLFAIIYSDISAAAVARVTRSLDPEKNWTRHATALCSLVLRPCSDDDDDDRFGVDRELVGVRGDLSVLMTC